MLITNGAYFLARVFHNAYQKAEEELGRAPVGDWDSLSGGDRKAMAQGMQILLNLKVIQPISLKSVFVLQDAGLIPRRGSNPN